MQIELPEHAIRYLKKMCEEERHRLARQEYIDQAPPSLQDLAAFDSLNAIESALP